MNTSKQPIIYKFWPILRFIFFHLGFCGFGATTQEITQEIEVTTQKIADKIIRLIEENPKLSRRAMAELVGISEDGVKYHLKILKKERKIIHIGPNKKGY
ncbi:MAG TPA: winged helix-turn-helix transcriptional regulator, partial [Candidatus Deferrimicrobium sp.]|nr:winged helix-turn-helix transcriptional regulator [Candidatus Deferrimicrobium sp.]